MKNSLIYYYGINIKEIRKIENNYYFCYGNNNYIISLYKRFEEETIPIYRLNEQMIKRQIPVFKIILTKTNNILFPYEDNLYILMMYPNIKNRLINYEDIIKFNYLVQEEKEFKALDKSEWAKLWENKIDYYEKEFEEIKEKYDTLKKSINYFIGLSENAISYYYDNLNQRNLRKVVSHIRIDINTDLFDFYNPLNLIIDFKERDIAEYLKSYIIKEKYTTDNLNKMITMKNNNRDSLIALIIRILIPTYFFDEYDKIILNKSNNLEEIIEKRKNINFLIKLIFNKYYYLNIPYINWIIKED